VAARLGVATTAWTVERRGAAALGGAARATAVEMHMADMMEVGRARGCGNVGRRPVQ
jgi:hypothetical protein